MINRSYAMENHNFDFLLFSMTNILKWPKEAICPQIAIYILICYKSMCLSWTLFVMAIFKQY